MIRYLVLLLFLMCSLMVSAQDHVDQYRAGMEAYQNEDYSVYLERMRKADLLRPNHRVLMYHLAKGYSLTGNNEMAFNTLVKRAAFYAIDDISPDSSFISFLNSEYWISFQARLKTLNESKDSSTLAFELQIEDFHGEGIEYIKERDRFYISDIRHGWIYSVDSEGNDIRKEFDLKELGYWSAMGMKADPIDKDIFWVTTSALPQYEHYQESFKGRSAILKLDLNSKKVLNRFELNSEHTFGDMIIDEVGTIYISDSAKPMIYRIKRGSERIEEFISHPDWWNLQGLTLSEDGSILYVSDYITGISCIELTSKKVRVLSTHNELLRGSDGIYLLNSKLILLQNGTVPKRVSTYDLASDHFEFIDNAVDYLNEPTLGVVVGSYLYFIANSPWAFYDTQGDPLSEEWKPLRVHRISLE